MYKIRFCFYHAQKIMEGQSFGVATFVQGKLVQEDFCPVQGDTAP